MLTAIVKTVCDLQDQIDDIDATLATLNANYTIGCLSGVTASSDTHDIVQATINNLCSLNTAFSALVSQLNATNVTSLNVNTYISNYLASQPSTNSASARMVPYCPIAYYGPLSGYPTATDSLSLTGQGTGYWAKVYLCNGLNGTPDLRGRAVVGTTVMGNNAFPSQTNPCGSCTTCSNPLYELGDVEGSNCITLTTPQLPNHTHTASTASAGSHNHYMVVAASQTTDNANSLYDGTNPGRKDLGLTSRAYGAGNNDYAYELTTSPGTVNAGRTNDSGVHTHPVTVNPTGSGDAHLNIQPVIALHYIMYKP